MSERTWFFASEGKQQGPYPEQQFRDFIARGAITADMLVWSEGMSGWQRAGDIPGLGARAVDPYAAGPAAAGGLSAEFSIWGLLGRGLLFIIGGLLVIPAPWVATMFYRWLIPTLRVPSRPNLGFTGQVGDIWYVFVLTGLVSYAGFTDIWWLPLALIPVNAFLAWMMLRWVVSNLSSSGQKLDLSFKGSPWAYIGWYVFMYFSFISIIGWAWVTSAFMRWLCRNIDGTRREVVFNGSGWDILWRTVVFVLASIFIIPIPWMLGWLMRWYVSQFAVVPHGSRSA